MPEWDPYAPQPVRKSAGLWPFVALFAIALLAAFTLFNRGGPLHDRDAAPRVIDPRGDLTALEKSTIELFRAVSPAVVFISTRVESRRFRFDPTQVEAGTGSGFVWDERGYIVTNYHVVKDGNAYTVTLSNGEVLDARLVGVWKFDDVAVLKVDPPAGVPLPTIAVGSSQDLVVGQSVFAIGNPFGLDSTLTTGVISGLGRSIEGVAGTRIEGVIQTDAAINPGNSGGPLLDSAGRLIGMNTAIYSPSGASAGIGFAVPVDRINSVVPELIRDGRVSLPGIGVTLIDPRMVRGVNGLLFSSVTPNTPAARAGLRPTEVTSRGQLRVGDILREIDGVSVKSLIDVQNVLLRKRVGDSVKLKVLRDSRTVEIPVELIDLQR